MTYTIKLRRDTASDWTTINPVLAEGEFGYEQDTRNFKIGNGSSSWNALEYVIDANDRLPDASGLDDNQILLTIGGVWTVVTLPSGLPDPTGVPDGYMLATLDDAWVVQAIPISPDELPDPSALADGKIATVLSGAWVAADPAPPASAGGPTILTGFLSGALVAGVGTTRFYNDTGADVTIANARLSLGSPPAGGPATVDLNLNGTTIFTTQANRPSVAAAGVTSGAKVPDVTNWPAGQYLTVDVDLIGTTTPGSNATIQIGLVT